MIQAKWPSATIQRAHRRGRSAPRAGIALLLLAALVLGCKTERAAEIAEKAVEPAGPTFMWRASAPEQPGKSLHLVGSIHVANDAFYPLPKPIEREFEKAGTLVVELDPTDQTKMATALLQLGMLPEDQTLQQVIGAELWTKVSAYAAAHGLPPESLRRFKPWVVALQLLNLQLLDVGLDPRLGVEAHFIGRARSKQIVALETAQYQLGIFNDLPAALQLLLLRDAVEGLSQPTAQEMQSLAQMWKEGDAPGVAALLTGYLNETPELGPLFDELFTQRNQTMTARIIELHQTHPALFVVVGAGHLVGPGGIVDHLTQMGWTVEQVSGS